MLKTKRIPLADLAQNIGQIPGLPMNPRTWTQGDIDRLAQSLRETPELFEARPIIAVPFEGKFVILGGNLRYEGARANGDTDAPVCVLPADMPVDKMKEIVIKDNGAFGSWDFDALANEWDDLPLKAWGATKWETSGDLAGQEPGDGGGSGGGLPTPSGLREKGDEEIEALLNDAMRENVRESVEQIDLLSTRGWLSSFLTRGLAQAKFLRAKYYGEHYPQWVSLYFTPERFKTSANSISPDEQLRLIAAGKTDAGIAGLRTLSGDHLLLLLKGSYPFGGARMPMDFPANVARALIEEFAGRGGSVLDPCHGWGGRLCGALMADVSLYVGVDPSPEAHAGVQREADAFAPYCPGSRVELIEAPFEAVDLGGRTFDFAITSPPYFDVEQYHGENQSHVLYPEYDLWVEKFFRPLIERTFAAMRPGGVFALQVGSQTYPIIDEAKRLAPEAGFAIEEIRPLGGGTSSPLHANTDEDPENEKIVILRKP